MTRQLFANSGDNFFNQITHRHLRCGLYSFCSFKTKYLFLGIHAVPDNVVLGYFPLFV